MTFPFQHASPARDPGSWHLGCRLRLGLPRPVFAKAGGRHAGDLMKDPVEMRQALKAHRVGDLTNPQVGVGQQALGPFDPRPAQVLGKGQPRGFLEDLAKVKGAHAQRPGHFAQMDRVGLMAGDVGSGPPDQGRFGLGGAQGKLVGHRAQLASKELQQAHGPARSAWRGSGFITLSDLQRFGATGLAAGQGFGDQAGRCDGEPCCGEVTDF